MEKSVKKEEKNPEQKPRQAPEATGHNEQPGDNLSDAPGQESSEGTVEDGSGQPTDTETTVEDVQSSGSGAAQSDTPEPVEPASADAASPPPAKRKGSWVAVVALILAICALVLAGYGYHRFDGIQKANVALLDGLKQTVEQGRSESTQARSEAAGLGGQIQQLKQQLGSEKRNVAELQDRLTRGMQQVSKVQGNSRKDWLLAEVEYLLRLANQRVLMENSPVGALALLESADKILMETDDVSIYNVRKALAKDIAALAAVPSLDVDGVFLKLAALNGQVKNLRVVPLTDKRELPALLKGITPDAVEESINQGLAASWNQAMDKLGNLVVIQHRDEPIEPLLSPEQNYFLQQNLQLMLEQAQLALLQGKQGSYDASLGKAVEWIGTYFEAQDATTLGLLKGLKDLKSVQVAPALPDISASLKALKAYLVEIHNGKGAA